MTVILRSEHQMLEPAYIRSHANKLIAISESVTDVPSKAALLDMASELKRWADELDGGARASVATRP